MKTSNYILISFFTFLFGGILMLFVAAKLHQRDNNTGHLLGSEKKLERFSVIVAGQGANFQLCTAEYPRILTYYQLPDSCKFPSYGIRNDTLFVFADTRTNKHSDPDVIYCKDVRSIVAKEKSYLNLQDFKINSNDTVIIKLNNAKIDVFYRDPIDINMAVSLQAQESEINLHQAHFKTLDVKIGQSKLNAWNITIENLSVILKDHSIMQAPAAMKKVSLEVDSTSHFNFYSVI